MYYWFKITRSRIYSLSAKKNYDCIDSVKHSKYGKSALDSGNAPERLRFRHRLGGLPSTYLLGREAGRRRGLRDAGSLSRAASHGTHACRLARGISAVGR